MREIAGIEAIYKFVSCRFRYEKAVAIVTSNFDYLLDCLLLELKFYQTVITTRFMETACAQC